MKAGAVILRGSAGGRREPCTFGVRDPARNGGRSDVADLIWKSNADVHEDVLFVVQLAENALRLPFPVLRLRSADTVGMRSTSRRRNHMTACCRDIL